MDKKFFTSLFLLTLVLCSVRLSAVDLKSVIKDYKNSIADVGFVLKYDDKGEVASAIGVYCGACSAFHDNDLAKLLANRQDLLVTGFIVADNKLMIPAMLIESAGIRDIYVKFKGKKYLADVISIYPDQGALLLKTRTPLAGAEPLKFAEYKKGEKLFSYSRINELGRWVSRCRSFSPDGDEVIMENSRSSRNVPGNSLIINAHGKAVAMLLNNNEAMENIPWQMNYTRWHSISVEKFSLMRKNLLENLKKSIMPVTIYMNEWKLSRREKIMNIIPDREICSYAFYLPGKKLFMPLLTTPQQHSRIEKIIVHTPQGDVECFIAGIMKNFGGILLLPKNKKVIDAPEISGKISPLAGNLGEIVWSAELGIYPKNIKIDLFSDILIAAARLYYNVEFGSTLKKGVPELLFNLSGELLGVNLSVRAFNYNRICPFTDAAAIEKMLADPRELVPLHAMCNPVDAVGFMGVEYQILNRDLVRSVNLEHLTDSGRTGLLISYVYPGSSADRIGLKSGDILLRILFPEGGAPIELTGKHFRLPQERQFPWKNLDSIPEVYFSEIPEPWKGVKNPLSLQLANIGIGKTIKLIVISRGKTVVKNMVIDNAPAYFEVAPAFRSGSIGLEVRNMTFEVRRYFRMSAETPGVIIADVYAGRAASIAGLRPFEIITAVDDQPVFNVDDFKKAVAGKSEVRLAVRRLAANRVVTVKLALGPRR